MFPISGFKRQHKWGGLLLVLLLYCLTQCSSPPKTYEQITRCFYYWKSVFIISPQQAATLKNLNITRLYVKFFDVDWLDNDNTAGPIAPIRFESAIPEGIDIVPVVYITNKTLKNLPDTLVPALADSIYHKLQNLLNTSGQTGMPCEIQFDCDWTTTTRQKYFLLLESFKNKVRPSQTLISATIRLHQIKYSTQTGVPPVERGVLMFYNMGNFKDPQTNNSILDLSEAEKYTSKLKQYPLPLDVALPVYSWGVVFRNGQFTNLINQLNTATAKTIPQILRPLGNNRYLALQSGMVNGSQVGKNDVVRIEETTTDNCTQAAGRLRQNLNTGGNLKVVLYHLDTDLFQHYPASDIEGIFSTF